jgi:hypothetical protein
MRCVWCEIMMIVNEERTLAIRPKTILFRKLDKTSSRQPPSDVKHDMIY